MASKETLEKIQQLAIAATALLEEANRLASEENVMFVYEAPSQVEFAESIADDEEWEVSDEEDWDESSRHWSEDWDDSNCY